MNSKLFALEEIESEVVEIADVDEVGLISPAADIEDADQNLAMVQDGFKQAMESIQIVGSIRDSLSAKKPCSNAYMTSLENYHPILEAVIGNLGLKRTIPSTEDFVNSYKAQAAHAIATEGLGDYIRKVWEKIKEFFSVFFRKVSLYLKRMVKANLDLEAYEKYLEPMMVKLKNGKPAPKDNKPFDTKLPMLLGDEGMQRMDSEYLLNYGVRKTENLLQLMERVGFKGVGILNEPQGLPMLNQQLQAFINRYAGNSVFKVDELKLEMDSLRALTIGIVTSVFEHNITDDKELPEAAYQAIHDGFSRAEFGEGFVLKSLAPNNAGRDGLPKDANIFLAHTASGNSMVTGYVANNTYTENRLTVPSSFKSLQAMYDFYRNRVAKAKVQLADKTLDKTNDLIVKLLEILTKKYAALVDQVGKLSGGSVKMDLADVLILAGKKNLTMTDIFNRVNGNMGFTDEDYSVDPQYGETFYRFINLEIEDTDRFRQDVRYAYQDQMDALFKNYGSSMQKFIELVGALVTGGHNPVSEEDMTVIKEAFKELGRSLTNMLTNLQSILRFVMTSVYGVYTELRYEWVRYIYMSAQRYGNEL